MTEKTPKNDITEVIEITSGGRHAWVKMMVGGEEVIVRKELKYVPKEILNKYDIEKEIIKEEKVS